MRVAAAQICLALLQVKLASSLATLRFEGAFPIGDASPSIGEPWALAAATDEEQQALLCHANSSGGTISCLHLSPADAANGSAVLQAFEASSMSSITHLELVHSGTGNILCYGERSSNNSNSSSLHCAVLSLNASGLYDEPVFQEVVSSMSAEEELAVAALDDDARSGSNSSNSPAILLCFGSSSSSDCQCSALVVSSNASSSNASSLSVAATVELPMLRRQTAGPDLSLKSALLAVADIGNNTALLCRSAANDTNASAPAAAGVFCSALRYSGEDGNSNAILQNASGEQLVLPRADSVVDLAIHRSQLSSAAAAVMCYGVESTGINGTEVACFDLWSISEDGMDVSEQTTIAESSLEGGASFALALTGVGDSTLALCYTGFASAEVSCHAITHHGSNLTVGEEQVWTTTGLSNQSSNDSAPDSLLLSGMPPSGGLLCYRLDYGSHCVSLESLRLSTSSSATTPPSPRLTTLSTTSTTTSSTEAFALAQLCPWLQDTGSEMYECMDGSRCSLPLCCSIAGGISRCPASEPVMCTALACGTDALADYCCSNLTSNCAENLGPRPCLAGHMVSTGWTGTLWIVEADGNAWAMGGNFRGQLGTGNQNTVREPTMVMSDVAQVASGQYHSALVKHDGTAWTTGLNSQGQLGRGDRLDSPFYVLAHQGVRAAAVGGLHTLFITLSDEVWACGWNSYGQLGDNSTTSRSEPVRVFSDVRSVHASSGHSIFVRFDGTAWGAGYNHVGELGDGTTENRREPVRLFSGVSEVSVGQSHTVFLRTDGTVWSTGYNFHGQLADGTIIDRLEPVQAQGVQQVVSISAGTHHTLFLQADGQVYAVGWNGNGQLGDGSVVDRTLPVRILEGVAAIYAGGSYSLFLKSDNSMWGCGANEVRQLGFPDINDRESPVQILEGMFVRWTTTTTTGTTTVSGVTGEVPETTSTTRATTTTWAGPVYEKEELSVFFIVVVIVAPLVLCCCCAAVGLILFEWLRNRHIAYKHRTNFQVEPHGQLHPTQETYTSWRKPVQKNPVTEEATGVHVHQHGHIGGPPMMAPAAWQQPGNGTAFNMATGATDPSPVAAGQQSPVHHAEGPILPGPPVPHGAADEMSPHVPVEQP